MLQNIALRWSLLFVVNKYATNITRRCRFKPAAEQQNICRQLFMK